MLATNFAGKPYAGKPHVRIDEGEGSDSMIAPPLYSTGKHCTREIELVTEQCQL